MRKQRFRKDDLSHPFRGKIMARIQSPFCSRQCSWQRAAPLGPQMAWFHKMPPRGFQVIWWQVAYWNGVLLTRSSVSHTKKIIWWLIRILTFFNGLRAMFKTMWVFPRYFLIHHLFLYVCHHFFIQQYLLNPTSQALPLNVSQKDKEGVFPVQNDLIV